MKKSAFSTIELMVIIIVVMLIMGSIVPSITKKLNTRSVSIGGVIGTSLSNIEFEPDCSHINSDCELCTSTTCMLCLKICPTGQYTRTSDCTCQPCSDLYGDDCLTCTNKKCKKCNSSHYLENGQCNICPAGNSCNGEIKTQCEDGYYQDEQGKTSCKSCEEKDPNCKTCNQTTGTCEVCKDGYILINGTCEMPCGELAMEVEIDGEKYCVTKYNIGDKTELSIPSTVTKATAGVDTCSSSETNFCCWQGTTGSNCDSANGGYSDCTRTVCDWWASNESCNKLTYLNKTWRLPASDEWESIGAQIDSVSIGQESSGLMLCGPAYSSSSARCAWIENCQGSYDNYCAPGNVWSLDLSGSTAKRYYLSSDVWYGPDYQPLSLIYSARCVSDL